MVYSCAPSGRVFSEPSSQMHTTRQADCRLVTLARSGQRIICHLCLCPLSNQCVTTRSMLWNISYSSPSQHLEARYNCFVLGA